MTTQATIYARFSNAEQAVGSSLDRQFRHCEEMARRHGWEVDTSRFIRDEGLSAFSGANRASGGALFDFEQRVEEGQFLGGHVLVVENFDRISRRGYEEVLSFLNKMADNGVTVAVVDGDRIYRAGERVPMAPVLEVILKAELAFEESQKKSKRLAAAWQRKIDTVQANDGKHIAHTVTVPAWINVERQTMKMTLNEDRCRLVREIFQLTIDGYGIPAISKRLNGRSEPLWDYRGRTSENGWSIGYLTRTITNRALLGEFRPKKSPKGGIPVSRGIVILDHYPQAIDPDTFARAQAARAERHNTSGAWQRSYENILSGIARCAHCGGRMWREVSRKKGTARYRGDRKGQTYQSRSNFSYMRCHNATYDIDDGTGKPRCTAKFRTRYEHLERGIVDLLIGFATSEQRPADIASIRKLEIEAAELRRQLDGRRDQAETAGKSYLETKSPTMERLMLRAEGEALDVEKALRESMAALDRERAEGFGGADPDAAFSDWSQQIHQLKEQIWCDDFPARQDARVKFRQVAGRYITQCVCDSDRMTHVILGDDVVCFTIGPDGKVVSTAVLHTEVIGPDGQRNWHPDDDEPEAGRIQRR